MHLACRTLCRLVFVRADNQRSVCLPPPDSQEKKEKRHKKERSTDKEPSQPPPAEEHDSKRQRREEVRLLCVASAGPVKVLRFRASWLRRLDQPELSRGV